MIITAIQRLYRYLKVKNAVNHATRMSNVLNREHFVIQIGRKMRVYDQHKINLLVEKGALKRSLLNIEILRRACIFTTHTKPCTSQKKIY